MLIYTRPKIVLKTNWSLTVDHTLFPLDAAVAEPWAMFNRPFYQYGGHIELIQFKEYYRMPRGHEHISFVFSSAFRDIFSLSFLRIRF